MTRYTPLWLQSGSYPAGNDRRLLEALWPASASTGLAVTLQPGTMTLNIAAGKYAVPLANGGTALCVSDAVEQVTAAPAPGAGLVRVDIVVGQARGNDIDGGPNNDFVFETVAGVPAVWPNPVGPPTPPNSALLAYYFVQGGAASIAPADLNDIRPGGLAVPNTARSPLGYVTDFSLPPSTITIGAGSGWYNLGNTGVVLDPRRRYAVTASIDGTVTAAGGSVSARINPNVGHVNGQLTQAIISGAAVATGTTTWYYVPNAAGPVSVFFAVEVMNP